MKSDSTDAGIGLGLASAVAICCGAKLLLVGLPALALLSSETLLVGAASAVALVGAGVLVWRRRLAGCTTACAPEPAAPAVRPRAGEPGQPDVAAAAWPPLATTGAWEAHQAPRAGAPVAAACGGAERDD
jgi:hypothetical protein